MSDTLFQHPVDSPRPLPLPPTPFSDPELDYVRVGLAPLLQAVSAQPENYLTRADVYVPPVPQTRGEIGISDALIEDLIIKTLYAQGETIGRDLATELGLKF